MSSVLSSRLISKTLRVQAFTPRQRFFRSSPRNYEQFLDADKQTFQQAISADRTDDRVVLVDFYADWCGPCKMLSPLLEKLTGEDNVKSGSGRPVDLVTVDIDSEPELASEYRVTSVPMVVAFKDGQNVAQFIGAVPEPAIKKFLMGL